MPAARAPSRWDDLRNWLGSPWRALLITLASLALILGFDYLEHTSKYSQVEFFQTLLAALSIGIAWTLVWGGISRLLRGEANLLANWSLGMLSAAVSVIGEDITQWLAFNLQSLSAYTTLDAVLGSLVMIVSLYGAMSIATNLRRPTRWLAATVPILLALGSTTLMPMLNDDKPVDSPPTLSVSFPSAFQLLDGESATEFVAGTSTLFEDRATEAARLLSEDQAE